MRIFDVYQHPEFGYEAIPRGFSWSAFLIPSLWATWRGMGSTALVLVAWSTLMFDVARFSTRWYDDPLLLIGVLALLVALFGLVPGVRGHRWHAARLRAEDYVWKYTIAAASRRRAIGAARRGRFGGRVLLTNGAG